MKKRWMHKGFALAAVLVLAAAMLFGCAAQKSAQYSYGGADYDSSAPAENSGEISAEESGILGGMARRGQRFAKAHLYRGNGDRERAV